MKWQHAATETTWKGKAKLTCSCGWQSRVVPIAESKEIHQEHTVHAGSVEKSKLPKHLPI